MAVPCWQRLLTDSYDGAVNHVYPVSCFHQALEHVPLTLSIYGSTREVILRGLDRQLAGKSPVPVVTPRHVSAGFSAPVPLLVLAALALVLVAVGVGEQVRRRLRRRPAS